MANKNTNTSRGSYKIDNGATVSIEAGNATGYAGMRAAQLSALTAVMVCDDFQRYNDSIQNNVIWLVSNIAQELENLITIVHQQGIELGANQDYQTWSNAISEARRAN